MKNSTNTTVELFGAAALVASLATGANAATITSTASGAWENTGTWVGGVAPGNGDTAIIENGHVVDIDDTNGGGNNPEQTLAVDVIVNAGGTFYANFGSGGASSLTLNGGELRTDARSTNWVFTGNIAINGAGNKFENRKTQASKTQSITAASMTGSGDLSITVSNRENGNQWSTLNIADMTGYTGTITHERRSGANLPNDANDGQKNYLEFENSIAKADASFGLVLTEFTYGASNEFSTFHGYNINDENVTVWLTSLTIGSVSVAARDTAYTRAELVALDAGFDNYFNNDGSTGLIGVVPEPGSLALLGMGGLFMLRRRRN